MPRKILFISLIVAGSVFLINALILFFFRPVSLQFNATGKATKVASFGGVDAFRVPNLHSGGIGGWSAEAGGYVDMLSPKETMYINPDIAPSILDQTSYLYRHEFTHILEKKLVAKASGGYPSALNPVRSIVYYVNLVKLNNDLTTLMPSINSKTRGYVPDKGLEAAAECYAQPYSDKSMAPVYYDAPYIFPKYCNAEQVSIAIGMFTGKWPEPLTAKQIATLTPVNITTKN